MLSIKAMFAAPPAFPVFCDRQHPCVPRKELFGFVLVKHLSRASTQRKNPMSKGPKQIIISNLTI
ncbi:hypothetical protein [Bradyrhizobium sp.]|jgi:hypothetical protein|uniref:hypothetical protein n=1 Tax=Bradyrhizobium sp. TaxID=376 RepID=UPI002E01B27B|nr:hypothetical protein [Bradyrhizobium sp.]